VNERLNQRKADFEQKTGGVSLRINKKYENLVFTFLMALGMSVLISFILVSINFGYNDRFLITWLKMWGEAFVCAFPIAYILPKGIRKVMKTITFVERN
jgi:hypothetical protein